MTETARINSLLERVADATEPNRPLFAEIFFACAGKQHPDIKARFAILLDAKAWIDAAMVLTACALPGWRVHTSNVRDFGQATLFAPQSDGSMGTTPSEPECHSGHVSLAILLAALRAAGQQSKRP